ncbi:hypothetical protein ACFWZU_02415 [Frateuria sp. GZRR33]|uniref:hypothetical protein n=1 Tax=Frateuria sp. GZRR33 TaxID=3351535 RepID=UPI003EDBE50B
MNFSFHIGSKEIWFDVEAKDDAHLDELSFVGLIENKFNGIVSSARRDGRGVNAIYEIKLRFREFDEYSHAQAHCSANLDKDGRIAKHYIGALQYADPNHRHAQELKSLAEAGHTSPH